jgi:ferredoxin--NADP+ reductase
MTISLSVAIVGSGPSGAYCAQLLVEDASLDARVDVYDRLPVPYGLVRYGVAPDHKKIKSITASFGEIFQDPRVRFVGNVTVGIDVMLDALRAHYDAVIVACGASVDRRLGIPGEERGGIFSAAEFVSWYSGHPDAEVDRFSLSAEQAVVVGVGNVALDVARMLVLTPDELRRTDVPGHVVDVLAASAIREITIVGRRGPASAKFTGKELAELADLDRADIIVDPADLDLDAEQAAVAAANPLSRRLMNMLNALADRPVRGGRKTIRFAFGLRPMEILGADTVHGVRFERSGAGSKLAELPAQFVLRSIGYRGRPLVGLPFDESSGTIPNVAGRVVGPAGSMPGVYVTGWIKRGPTGVIGTNRRDAAETVEALVQDLQDLHSHTSSPLNPQDDLLDRMRLGGAVLVDWAGWCAIERAEQERGARLGRERVKIHEWERMLSAAASVAVSGG